MFLPFGEPGNRNGPLHPHFMLGVVQRVVMHLHTLSFIIMYICSITLMPLKITIILKYQSYKHVFDCLVGAAVMYTTAVHKDLGSIPE